MRTAFRLLPALLIFASSAFADAPGYWPQWRGPTGQGYVDDNRVPLEWSATKNLLWKAKLPGAGHSTPIIWGDRVFLTCCNTNGSQRWIVCVNAKTGAMIWEKIAYKGGPDQTYTQTSNHATASCATDGKYVYAFFGTPGIYCYDFAGNRIWHHSFGIFTSQPGWGVGASPVLFDDLVIQNCDNDFPDFVPKGVNPKDCALPNLVALNKTTGNIVWQTPRNQGRGFSTPVLIPTTTRTDLVLNGPLGVWGYDPKTGKEQWHCDRHPAEDNNRFGEPMPLFRGDTMFAAAGRDKGYLQAIRLGGEGDVTKSGLEWEVRRPGVRDVGSGILTGDYLIYADGRGALISTYDIKTGKQFFSQAAPGVRGKGGAAFYASPVQIQGKVLCLHSSGTMFILDPGPVLKIVGQNVLSDGTDFCASPAVADAKMYLRSQTHLYCVGSK